MTESPPERCLTLISEIVDLTLKGKIRSKEQVYQMLQQGVAPGLGELFERCLQERLQDTQHQAETVKDEFKQAKAARSLRALQTIQSEWQRWQEQNQERQLLATTVQQIAIAPPDQQLNIFLQMLDPNRPKVLGIAQWPALAKALREAAQPQSEGILLDLSAGLIQSLSAWQQLADCLVSWIYDQSQGQLGFEGVPGQRGPWALWSRQVSGHPVLTSFFQTLAFNAEITDWATQNSNLDTQTWVELTLILQCLQQGLVNWFDKLIYDSKAGAKLSISTFLTFAVIWSQLANGFQRISTGTRYVDTAFQMTLQILRTFSQQSYFPLYGGIFASFSGQYLRNALDYLDEPLRRAEGTQAKARILTLLGYTCRAQGQYDRAINFHFQALQIATEAADQSCEIASFNHLSRTYLAQKLYAEAIDFSQRALIRSRQIGDRLGEVNALSNLGYSEVLQAQQQGQTEPEVYETAVYYLQQGLSLAERLGDGQSRALCLSSLGIAQIVLQQYSEAIPTLEQSMQVAQYSGDLYLQGQSLSYLAEAYYHQGETDKAIYTGCLGMYLLEQIASQTWRQPAGLLVLLQGQLGKEAFQQSLEKYRPQILAVIGVDGYDYIPNLLMQYRSSAD